MLRLSLESTNVLEKNKVKVVLYRGNFDLRTIELQHAHKRGKCNLNLANKEKIVENKVSTLRFL